MEIPRTYGEAKTSPCAVQWKEAIRRDLRSHFSNHTWDAVRRPFGANVIGCKWVFTMKRDGEGNIVRYNARLVAQRFHQRYGVDYWDTYSPVPSLNTVRVFLAMCCQRGHLIRQLDVKTAFLNGDLEETVFMRAPEGINLGEDIVCQLRRSIYGLKQAAAV
ncbi:polyprotein [Phytophthora megakarya]|uniref:Polyprotein n=1 Tax=Phytophthora megakarya TaxID=4795 RepID=A0A225WC70_9STRA|nr:polyprotein [Phytophthora megakarya]